MNPRVDQDWTPSEVEEARSIIVRLNNNGCCCDGDGHDKNNNKKHDIMDELHAWFPWKTMRQVTDLYVNLAVQINMLQWQEEENCGADRTKGASSTAVGFVNKNFGVQEEHEATMDGKDFVLGFPSEEKRVMEIEEEASVVEKNKVEVLENKMASHQPAVAPNARRFWTKEEHRLFLHGLCAYGRGQWKSISKYFVTTRTPVQVSSHAQKYFKRLESKGPGRKRYSINDVGLHDDDWMAKNNFNGWKAPTFTGASASDYYPNLHLVAPTNSSIIMKKNAQFWSPFPKQASQRPAWSEQQMVVSAAAPMEGTGGKQGSA